MAGHKPYARFTHLDLTENADEPLQRWRFGCRGSRKALIAELQALRAAGADHVGLHFRRNLRPLDETFHENAEHVLPVFSSFTAPGDSTGPGDLQCLISKIPCAWPGKALSPR